MLQVKSNSETSRLNFIYKSWHFFQKDFKQEFRTRYAINAIILFAVVTLVAISFSIGTYGADNTTKAALLWVILFFSAMSGLAHIFNREEEKHTSETLKLVVEPLVVYAGKLLFNFLLLLVLEVIIIPLFFMVMNYSVQNLPLFIAILFLGSIGLSSGATIIAAIISKAGARGALFSVLSFPILLPVLITGISATRIIVIQSDVTAISKELQMLFAYSVVIITASVLLFDVIWKE
jgi:heme exporter protein B